MKITNILICSATLLVYGCNEKSEVNYKIVRDTVIERLGRDTIEVQNPNGKIECKIIESNDTVFKVDTIAQP